jgi:FecR protein
VETTFDGVPKVDHIFQGTSFPGGVAMLHRYSPITIIALIGAVVIGGRVLAEIPFGTVTAVNGVVTVTHGGKTRPAKYGESVQVGDRIATGADARVTLTLSDNSQMQLTESSILDLTESMAGPNGRRASTRVSLLEGLVRSRIRSGSGAPSNFEIRTPNAIVRGTAYDIDYRKGVTRRDYADCREFTDVTVYNGTATVSKVNDPAAPSVRVHEGQRTVVPCGLAVASATSSSGASTGMSASAIAAMSALGIAGIGGGAAAALAGGGSSGGSDPISRSPASSSQ